MYCCKAISYYFFFNDTATTEIYTLSLHDALPILATASGRRRRSIAHWRSTQRTSMHSTTSRRSSSPRVGSTWRSRSEEHTSELQSRQYLVCRLLLEKKKKNKKYTDDNTYQ